MKLVLVRHADARPAVDGGDDARRPLTGGGLRVSRHVTDGLAQLDIRFDRLLHSPLLRAIETAEVLSALLDGESVACPELAGEPTRALLTKIEDAGECAGLVGHAPHLGALVAWLVSGDRNDGERFVVRKGGVVILEGEPAPERMTLQALLPPEAL